MQWGTPEERERRRRIMLAVWAYAYEFLNESLVDDATYDAESRLVDLSINTNNKKMDDWFRSNFTPSTGMWVHRHPGLVRLKVIAERMVERAHN